MEEEIWIDVCDLTRFWREASQNETAALWQWGSGEKHFKAAIASRDAAVEGDVRDTYK